MNFSKENLAAIMPNASTANIAKFCDQLNLTMAKYGINTPLRSAMFIANLAHESCNFLYTHELWEPTAQQKLYERDFTQPWKAGLKTSDRNYLAFSLGNSEKGDGFFFRGHGLIETTGRLNHAALTLAFGIDFVHHPELLEGVVYACESAGYYWFHAGCNQMADKNDFDGSCDLINRGHKTPVVGDSIGWKERVLFFENAKKVLGIK